MRDKLNAMLGRSTFKTSKFKPLVTLAISRLAVLKNQRQVRCTQALSDAVELLQLGHQDRALLRVEHLIKEQNMLDVYVMIEGYCNLLIERIHLLEQERVCPDELKEAVSGILYASSRCGDFPELQEIRIMLTSRFGKEFAAGAIELRNNCGINRLMITKLTTRQPSLENRMNVLKEIAYGKGIALQLEEAPSFSTEDISDKNQNQSAPSQTSNLSGNRSRDKLHNLPEEIVKDGEFSGSINARKKYRGVADAAQAAFESAAYAAEAARAAMELSRSDSHDFDNDNSPSSRQGGSPYKSEPKKQESASEKEEIPIIKQVEQFNSLSSGPAKYTRKETPKLFVGDQTDHTEKDVVFDESDDETGDQQNSSSSSPVPIPSRFQAGPRVESVSNRSVAHADVESGVHDAPVLNLEKKSFSMRTTGVRGY